MHAYVDEGADVGHDAFDGHAFFDVLEGVHVFARARRFETLARVAIWFFSSHPRSMPPFNHSPVAGPTAPALCSGGGASAQRPGQ